MNNKKGFTLVEMIVVVSIISLIYLGINNTLVNIINIFQLKNEAQKLALNLHNLRNNCLRLSEDGICYLYQDYYVLKMKKYYGT